VSDYERGWNAAIEAAAQRFWALSQRGDMVIKFAGMIQAECHAIRALAKPEPATAAPRHDNRECEAVSHGARGVADGKVCVLSVGHAGHHQSVKGAMWDRVTPLDLGVKAALTGDEK
jgi:hypothetical protein